MSIELESALAIYLGVGMLVFLIVGFFLASENESPVPAFVIGVFWFPLLCLWIIYCILDEHENKKQGKNYD